MRSNNFFGRYLRKSKGKHFSFCKCPRKIDSNQYYFLEKAFLHSFLSGKRLRQQHSMKSSPPPLSLSLFALSPDITLTGKGGRETEIPKRGGHRGCSLTRKKRTSSSADTHCGMLCVNEGPYKRRPGRRSLQKCGSLSSPVKWE